MPIINNYGSAASYGTLNISTNPAGVAAGIAAANPTTPINPTTEGALVSGQSGLNSATVNALLGYNNDIAQAQQSQIVDQGQAQENAVSAQGYGLQSQGYAQEQSAYDTAANIAAQNAQLALASGQVQAYQEGVAIRQTLGKIRADAAANGFFAGSGSNLAAYAESMRQGNLQLATTNMQAAMQAGGYQEAGAATQAEAAAVGVAAQGASTAQQEATIAQQTDLNSANYAGVTAATARTNEQNLINLIGSLGVGTTGAGAGAGGGGGGGGLGPGGTFAGVSEQEAAQDAAALGYKYTAGPSGNGGFTFTNPTSIQVNDQGKQAAAQYMAAVEKGTVAPDSGPLFSAKISPVVGGMGPLPLS